MGRRIAWALAAASPLAAGLIAAGLIAAPPAAATPAICPAPGTPSDAVDPLYDQRGEPVDAAKRALAGEPGIAAVCTVNTVPPRVEADVVVAGEVVDYPVTAAEATGWVIFLWQGVRLPDFKSQSRSAVAADAPAYGLSVQVDPAAAADDWLFVRQQPPAGQLAIFGATVTVTYAPPPPAVPPSTPPPTSTAPPSTTPTRTPPGTSPPGTAPATTAAPRTRPPSVVDVASVGPTTATPAPGVQVRITVDEPRVPAPPASGIAAVRAPSTPRLVVVSENQRVVHLPAWLVGLTVASALGLVSALIRRRRVPTPAARAHSPYASPRIRVHGVPPPIDGEPPPELHQPDRAVRVAVRPDRGRRVLTEEGP